MSKPVELAESSGDEPQKLLVDPKIWNADSQAHTTPVLNKQQQDLSVVRGNELVVAPVDASIKLSSPFKTKIESAAPGESTDGAVKSQTKFKQAELKPEPIPKSESSALTLKAATAQTSVESSSFTLNPKFKTEQAARVESAALPSDVVSKQITVSKSDRTVLPTVDFVEPRGTEPTLAKQQSAQARVERADVLSPNQTIQANQAIQADKQVLPARVDARPEIQTAQIAQPIRLDSPQPEPKLLNRLQEVVQKTDIQQDLQIVDKTQIKSNLKIASNAVIERGDDNSLTVQNARSERPVSARLEHVIADASATRIPGELREVKLANQNDAVRFIATPGSNNLVGFSRYVEMNQIASLRPQASFNIRPAEIAPRIESLQTVLAARTAEIAPRRSPFVASIVKSVISGVQTGQLAPAADLAALQSGPKVNLDAQSIIKANFNPATIATTGNAAMVRGEFTIRDFRPASAITPGDIRTNINSDMRTDGRAPIVGINGVEFSFGKRKKKDLTGPRRTTDSTCSGSRYITGLELGLIVALAGIAKFDANDRGNRKAFNQSDLESAHLTMDASKFAKAIGKSIENKKVKKRLPSYNWNNEWKSPGKIQVKNVLEKLKKERKDLNAKDLEKLESSTNKEELLSRLGKLVKNDEKALDVKHMLSSFSGSLAEKFKATKNAIGQPQSLTNYRPLWLVCENDTLANLAEQIYQDSDVAWLIADMNITRVRETWLNNKRVIQMQSRQQIELPIQEDIDLFKQNKSQEQCSENLITVVIQNQLDKDHMNSQLQALQIKRKAFGTT